VAATLLHFYWQNHRHGERKSTRKGQEGKLARSREYAGKIVDIDVSSEMSESLRDAYSVIYSSRFARCP
jgi:hypothetical protein